MNNRLEELRKELERGRQRLELLDRERQGVRDIMLRISGAIQVLEELKTSETPCTPESELATMNP